MNDLSVTPTTQVNSQQPSVEEIVNSLFKKLAASSPALLSVGEEQLSVIKKQWILGFVENGIKTIEQVQDGMRIARAKNNGYLPSVGEFIAYCRQGQFKRLELPSFEEFKHRLNKFRANGGFAEIDRFEFMSVAEYWLITEIANKSIQKSYTEAEEAKAMNEALEKMAKRLEKGEVLPKPTRSLPEKVEYLDPEKVKQGWANLKALVARG